MRCLYIVAHDPISPNYLGGASAMYYDQLLALSELGHEVHLWHFASGEARDRFNRFVAGEPGVWEAVKKSCNSIHLSSCRDQETVLERGLARLHGWLPPGLPVSHWSLHQELQRLIQRFKPDVIWAQHYAPGMLAAQQFGVPVVYVHHDWLYRIKALRNHHDINPRQKAIEERLVRCVSAIVSGSQPECEEISKAGGRKVQYLPVSYELASIDYEHASDKSPQLVHLGGMGTTANREGLLAFFERVWPALETDGVELEVIGDTTGASETLQGYLRKVRCSGFIKDLTTVLRPFDIHVIPWEYSTGQRTRLPVAFNHAQAVVATRAAVACYPEARDGENCRLVDRLEDMIPVTKQLMADCSERSRLGHAARATFERQFTRAALLPRYRKVLDSIDSQ